jgi:hypothetical protein
MAADAGRKAHAGEDVRDVFEAMLPRHWIDRLCVRCGVIERQHKRHLECGSGRMSTEMHKHRSILTHALVTV